MSIKVMAFAIYGHNAASHRYRLSQFKELLRNNDIDLEINSLLNNQYLNESFSGKKPSKANIIYSYLKRMRILLFRNDYDLIIIHCELFKFFPWWLESLLIRKNFIYDFDDAFFLNYRQNKTSLINVLLGNKFNFVLKNATAVLAGNNYLKNFSEAFNSNVYLFPTVLSLNAYKYCEPNDRKIPTIGWIGSPSTAKYLNIVKEPLSELSKKIKFQFVCIGAKPPKIDGVLTKYLEWNENTYIQNIRDFDIGIMPLYDSSWEKGKCAFKLLQYMAVGRPVVASRVGANNDVVNNDVGFLAKSKEDWVNYLTILLTSKEKRLNMGLKGRNLIEAKYSTEEAVKRLSSIISRSITIKS
jgi:glycosyltransferase involved in cell wall biosynthesis